MLKGEKDEIIKRVKAFDVLFRIIDNPFVWLCLFISVGLVGKGYFVSYLSFFVNIMASYHVSFTVPPLIFYVIISPIIVSKIGKIEVPRSIEIKYKTIDISKFMIFFLVSLLSFFYGFMWWGILFLLSIVSIFLIRLISEQIFLYKD